MKIKFTLVGFFLLGCSALAQNVAINNNGASPNSNAILDVDVTTNDKGILIPRVTSAQRAAIGGLGAGDEGLTVYDETTNSYWLWDGAVWIEMSRCQSYSASGTTDINTSIDNSGGGGFTNMAGMSITFTPVNSEVIVTFSASGTYLTNNYDQHIAMFRIRQGTTTEQEFYTVTQDQWNLYDVSISVPVTVTPGVSTTITVQWDGLRGSAPNSTLYNNASTQAYSYRHLIVDDCE